VSRQPTEKRKRQIFHSRNQHNEYITVLKPLVNLQERCVKCFSKRIALSVIFGLLSLIENTPNSRPKEISLVHPSC
jgi:hypothetical protein